MPETTGLRARKKQRTRRTIERVALDLFERNGFDGTTIDDIAAAAEIAPRTFFHYFPSKEDVVVASYAQRLELIVSALEASSPDESPWQALRGAFRGVAADYESGRDDLLRRFRIIQSTPSVAARNLQVQSTWEEAVTETIHRRFDLGAVGDIRPSLIAGAALTAMRASLRRWLSDGGESRLPDHVGYCFDLLGTGMEGACRSS